MLGRRSGSERFGGTLGAPPATVVSWGGGHRSSGGWVQRETGNGILRRGAAECAGKLWGRLSVSVMQEVPGGIWILICCALLVAQCLQPVGASPHLCGAHTGHGFRWEWGLQNGGGRAMHGTEQSRRRTTLASAEVDTYWGTDADDTEWGGAAPLPLNCARPWLLLLTMMGEML